MHKLKKCVENFCQLNNFVMDTMCNAETESKKRVAIKTNGIYLGVCQFCEPCRLWCACVCVHEYARLVVVSACMCLYRKWAKL